jgi:hypothetical protein
MYERSSAEVMSASAPDSQGIEPARPEVRAPYQAPALERLGPWQTFTLQQTIPIFP